MVEEVGFVWRAHDENDAGRFVFGEQFVEEASEGGDAGAGGEEDVVVLGGVLWEEKAFAVGSGESDFVAFLEVAEVVGGDAEEELAGFPVFVESSFDDGGEDFAVAVFAGGGVGEGVEAWSVGLAAVVGAGGEDADGLTAHADAFERRAGDVELDVADEAGGLSGGGADVVLGDAGGSGLVGPACVEGGVGKNGDVRRVCGGGVHGVRG